MADPDDPVQQSDAAESAEAGFDADPTLDTVAVAALMDELRTVWAETITDPDLFQTGDPQRTWRPAGRDRHGLPVPDQMQVSATDARIAEELANGGEPAGAGPGDRTGARFEIVDKIGEGGMGVVWRARQVSLKREVALKQVKRGDEAGERFLAEAMVTAALDHPNIVPVHGLGRDAGGNLFLAMKLARGTTWRRLLHPETRDERETAARFDEEDHLRILLAVCNAIEYAHAKGIIHRDLKPENVMVGDYGEVLVMDWGLAATVVQDAGAERKEGAAAAAAAPADGKPDTARVCRLPDHLARPPAGTPAYMPPEMARGQQSQISTLSDVYLLGATLYEILSGNPPHRGGSLIEAIADAARGFPPALPVDLPGELVDLCYTAMARDPAERFPTVRAFRQALVDYLGHRQSIAITTRAESEVEELEADQDPAGTDRQRLYARHARVVSRFEQALELWCDNREAQEGAQRARLAYARTALAAGDLGLAEAQLGQLGVETAPEREIRAQINLARLNAQRRERASRRLRWSLAVAIVTILIGVGVGSLLIEQKDLARQRAETSRERAETDRLKERQEALLQARQDEVNRATIKLKALPLYTEALDLIMRGQAIDPKVRSQPLDQAADLCRRALQIDPGFIEARFALGEALRRSGHPARAAEEFLRADRTSEELGHKPYPQALVAAGFAFDAAGEFTRAEDCFARAEAVGAKDPLALVGRAFRLSYQQRSAEALAVARQAKEAGPQLWECVYIHGRCLFEAAQLGILNPGQAIPEATAELRHAMTLSPRQADICAALANVLFSQESQRDQREARELIDRNVEYEHENGARWLFRASMRANRSDDRQGPEQDLAQALRLGVSQVLLLRYRVIEAVNGPKPDPQAAFTFLTQLVEACDWPVNRFHWFSLAFALGRNDEQIGKDFAAWCGRNPDYPMTHVLRASRAAESGDMRGAMAFLREGLAKAPFNSQLLAMLADLQQRDGRFEEAVATQNRILDIQPGNNRIRFEKVKNLFDLGRYREADEILRYLEYDLSNLPPDQRSGPAQVYRPWRQAIDRKLKP